MCNVLRRGNGVLLEGAINGVSGQLGGQAEGFVGLLAEGARQARVVEPFDTNGLANLSILIGDTGSTGNDDAGTFVAADKR